MWEYGEDGQSKGEDEADNSVVDENRSEFLEDSSADEMVEVEILLEAEVAEVAEVKDLDPTGTKTREFELELAVDEERSQNVGTISSWSIEPFKASVAAPVQASSQPAKDEDTVSQAPQGRSRNLEETAAISTEVARRAVAELNMSLSQTDLEKNPDTSRDLTGELSDAVKEKGDTPAKPKVTPWISEKKEEEAFSVHFVQADEESTVEDLEPIVASENGAEKSDEASISQNSAPPGNEETSEWQLVYKISGSLADALMSEDDDEADMSNLAPKLDDVNVFVTPGQFAGPPISDEWDRIEENDESSKDIISDDEKES